MARAGNNHKGGRPKGKKNQSTLDKERVLTGYRQKIMENVGFLFRSQAHLAKGVSYLYKFEKGKAKPTLVTDTEEIEEYILSEENLKSNNPKKQTYKKLDRKASYYFITTERPDNRAIDSMLDRAFGKAVQPIGGDKDNPIMVTGVKISTQK